MRDNPAVRTDPNHLGSDGSTPQQRIADAGYAPVSRTGEIMYFALGLPGNSVQANVDWWMNSPPHRALIEDCGFTHAGSVSSTPAAPSGSASSTSEPTEPSPARAQGPALRCWARCWSTGR